MKKKIMILGLMFAFFVLVRPAFSVDCTKERCAACDHCGYCQGAAMPQSWPACRNCLYPVLTGAPAQNNETLKILPGSNIPPTPHLGRAYTMIGCLKTDLGSFESEGAAASVVQILLNGIFSIGGGLAFMYIIYGAYLILTSQSDPEKLNHGKRVVWGALVGIIFALSSIFIINLVASGILRIPGFK